MTNNNENIQMNFSLIDPDLTIEVTAWQAGNQSNSNSYVSWGINNKFPAIIGNPHNIIKIISFNM